MRFARIIAALLFALLGPGCYNMRTHDTAPYIGIDKDGTKLAKYLQERIPEHDLHVARSLRVATSYRPPEQNEMGEWEQVGASLVPLWPYARGEFASPEIPQAQTVLEKLLAPYFRREGEGTRSVLVEVGFTEETYRRLTSTVYGLSIYGGIWYLTGVPIQYGTVSLDADVRVLDYLASRQEDVQIHEGKAHGEETACRGHFLFFFSYNALSRMPLTKGAPPITWDDLFAEAMIDFTAGALGTLEEAFPERCARCRLDYPASVERCEECGGALARRDGKAAPKREKKPAPSQDG